MIVHGLNRIITVQTVDALNVEIRAIEVLVEIINTIQEVALITL